MRKAERLRAARAVELVAGQGAGHGGGFAGDLELVENLLGADQGHTAAGDDTFFHGCTSRMEGILNAARAEERQGKDVVSPREAEGER